MSGKHTASGKRVAKRKSRRRKSFLFVLLLVLTAALFIVLTCCGGPEDEPEEIPSGDVSVEQRPQPPQLPQTPPVTNPVEEVDPQPEGELNPLTGLYMEMNEAAVDRRPVAITINNIRASLPQLGISKADIIVEMLAEGGISRLLAIYKDSSQVGRIGSVRSLRPYFLDMAQGFGAITLHFGGSVPAYEAIDVRNPPHIDGIKGGWEGSLYIRDPDRKKNLGYEHSVLTSGERIEEALATLKESVIALPDQQSVFDFDETHSALSGTEYTVVSIKSVSSNKPWFEYDAESDRYLRFEYGEAQMDDEYDVQIGTRNLIVLQMPTASVQNSELKLINVATTGDGSGWYCCGGKTVELNWSKAGYDKPLVLTGKDGSPLKVAPGNTFITCIPTTKTPEFS